MLRGLRQAACGGGCLARFWLYGVVRTVNDEPTLSRANPRRRDLLVLLVLVAAGLGIYGQTLRFPFIAFDDPGYVYDNAHVRTGLSWACVRWAFTSFELSNWHPLTWLSLMLDAQFYGLNAGGYHLTNLLLHLADAALLYVWLRQATGAFWPCALTAFFFVAHPLHVESVTWVTERKDVLSTLFFCLTLLAYTRYARGGGARAYSLALGLFALGLMSKPMLVTLPPVLVLLDFWPLRRTPLEPGARVRWTRLGLEKIPFFALAAASCAVTFLAQRATAVVPLGTLPVGYRLTSMLLGYGAYLRKTLLPVDLGIFYPYWHGQSPVAPFAWGLVLAVVTAGAFAVWRRMPWMAVGWCWFLGTLVPVIGFVQVGGQAVADRYAYLPHVGLFMAVFWSGAALAGGWPRVRPWLGGLAAAAALVCVGLSWRQAGFWRDNHALFGHSLAVAGPTARLYHLLGDALVEENRPDDALRSYREALRLSPGDLTTAAKWSKLAGARGQWEEMSSVLEAPCAHPEADAPMLNNFAYSLAKTGRAQQAESVYRRALQTDPDHALAHFGLGDLLLARGDMAGAADQYGEGLTRRDDYVPALARLARIYAVSGDAKLYEGASLLARRAVDLSHGADLASMDALAAADAALGQWEQADADASTALHLANQPGASSPDASKLCLARLEQYRRHQGPTP